MSIIGKKMFWRGHTPPKAADERGDSAYPWKALERRLGCRIGTDLGALAAGTFTEVGSSDNRQNKTINLKFLVVNSGVCHACICQ